MKTVATFHGWGFNHKVFEPILDCLKNQFGDIEILEYERGYFDEDAHLIPQNQHIDIVITHSMGLFFALDSKISCDYLITIGSFANFTGNVRVKKLLRAKFVERMIQAFKENESEVLNEFYKNCHFPTSLNTENIPSFNEYDKELLLNDLEALLNRDLLEDEHQLKVNKKSILFHGAQDRIASVDLLSELASYLTANSEASCSEFIIEEAGHLCFLTHDEFCKMNMNLLLEKNESA